MGILSISIFKSTVEELRQDHARERRKLIRSIRLANQRADGPRKAENCLTPGHWDRPVKSRGLCAVCYNAAGRLIKRRLTTWKKLEEEGKALPKYIAYNGPARRLLN